MSDQVAFIFIIATIVSYIIFVVTLYVSLYNSSNEPENVLDWMILLAVALLATMVWPITLTLLLIAAAGNYLQRRFKEINR